MKFEIEIDYKDLSGDQDFHSLSVLTDPAPFASIEYNATKHSINELSSSVRGALRKWETVLLSQVLFREPSESPYSIKAS